MENDLVGDEKMQSVFAGVRLHAWLARACVGAQILTALSALARSGCFERRAFRQRLKPPLVCAGLLASPFVLDYDLTLLAVPLVWLLGEGRRSGFLPYEKALMALAFVAPPRFARRGRRVRVAAGALNHRRTAPLILRRALAPGARAPRKSISSLSWR